MFHRKLVEDFESLRQVISTYAAESAAKMRREGLACSSAVVFLETNRFMDEPQYNPCVRVPLPYATDNTAEIIQTAIAGLERIFQAGYRYNKGGVMVEGLIPVSQRQTSLLDPYDRNRVARLMQALDIVNATYRLGTLRYGLQGFRNAKWQMRQNHLSTANNRGLMTEHQQTKRICELGQSTHLIGAL